MTESILRPIAQCGKCLASVDPSATFCDSCGSFFADSRMIQAAGLPESASVKLTRSGDLKFKATNIYSGTGMTTSGVFLLEGRPGKVLVCRSLRIRYPSDITSMDFTLIVNGIYQHGSEPSKMFTLDDGGYAGLTDFSLLFNQVVPAPYRESYSGVFQLENVVLIEGDWIMLRGNDQTPSNNYTSTNYNSMEWVVEYFEHDRSKT